MRETLGWLARLATDKSGWEAGVARIGGTIDISRHSRHLCKLSKSYKTTGDIFDMDLNLAAFTPSVSLREVLSHVRICFHFQCVVVHA
jgi:hypothetical protein